MSSEWLTVEALLRDGDLALIQDGNHGGSYPKVEEFIADGVPLITGACLIDGGVDYAKAGFISHSRAAQLRVGFAKPGDVLLTHKGTMGKTAIVPESRYPTTILNPQITLYRVAESGRLQARYLKFFFDSQIFQRLLIQISATSTINTLPIKEQKKLEIPVPSQETQNEVVGVLGALDDRITLLRETNTTLEAIAQALFKSWFVDFDPVHARARGEEPAGLAPEVAALFPDSFEESELGMVPKGWKVGVLGEVADTVRKQIQPGAMTADTLYVGLEHIPRLSLGLNAWGTAEELESAKSCFEKGDVLFGKLRPYFHKIVIAPFEGVCSTDILVCRAKSPEYYAFVLMHLFSTELVSYADRLSNGAKMPRVNWNDLAAYQVAIPPTELALTYMDVVKPMFAQITDNVLQAQTLAILRDALLPRLISGQLRLPETEAALQEAGL
ncbi:restriction endonuclease subunit S [Aeromonas hydrophila]|jgi:type I restriction enzyme S subunit|uniref:restriction endonuclease subunit S n=1 Tax=Aeromonas hydrophila TaxID=644 RepID=UPI0029276C9A|nr:restriction endonuclease subunit S [Aeromonas hydrophila]